MTKDIFVVKRSGEKEKFSPAKINKLLKWASDGLDVDISVIMEHFEFNYTSDGISTKDIHKSLIEACIDLISVNTPDYQIIAGRLLNYSLRKEVWGGINPPRLIDLIKSNVKLGYYDKDILSQYTAKEINKINEFIDHDRDLLFVHCGIKQLIDKYLVQNRKTGDIFETPQFAYVLVAMTLFSCEQHDRLSWIKRAYDYFSTFKINLATPIIAGARTPLRSFASCALFSVGDSLNSIGTTDYLLKKASASRYGLGLDISRIRPVGSSIRHGDVLHTGLVPYLKNFESGIKATHQNGLRGSSATVFINWWHMQVEDVLVLKNNALPDERAVRFLDYCLVFSDLFIDRIRKKENITLFNPNETPELVENFGLPGWDELYLLREKDTSISKKVISSLDLITVYAKERLATGRIYSMHAENSNRYTPFKERVGQSNLCVAGNQRIPSNFGLLTAKELYDLGQPLELFDNIETVSSTKIELIEKNVETIKVILENGLSHTITPYHKLVKRKRRKTNTKETLVENVECRDLKVGDYIAFQTRKGIFGKKHMPDEAFLLGLYQADGTQNNDSIYICLWENDFDLLEEVQSKFNKIYYKYQCNKSVIVNQFGQTSSFREVVPAKFSDCDTGVSLVRKKSLVSKCLKKYLNFQKGIIPQWIWESDEKTQWEYVRGLYYADGTVNITNGKGSPFYLSITNINKLFLEDLQILLLNLGIKCSLSLNMEAGQALLPDGKGGKKLYNTKDSYRLVTGNKPDGLIFEKNTKFLSRKGIYLEDKEYRNNTKKFSKIKSIEYVGKQDVFCCKVNSDRHHFICNGFVSHNCLEVLGPTTPSEKWNDGNGRIHVCILGGVNATTEDESELESICEVEVRLLDNLISYQSYFDLAAETFASKYRSLAIGTFNFAAYLANKKVRYDSPEAPILAAEFAEKLSFYTIKASINLAKERGRFEYFDKTNWADGELPIDRYCKKVDEFTNPVKMDWESLRSDLKKYGIRHSTLTSFMPVESTSIISGSTSGLEPIRDFIVSKTSKAGKVVSVAPNIKNNKDFYSLAFDLPIDAMQKVYAAINKFTCMAISANTYINISHYENKQIPLSVVVKDTFNYFDLGGKTQYYFNTEDDSGETSGCDGGSCSL